MKRIGGIISLLFVLLLVGTTFAHAQSNVSAYFGLGTATDSSSGQRIETFGDGILYPTPKLTGLFGSLGASFMLKRHLGIGVGYSFRFAQAPYAGLKYRPRFYDFNAIWLPLSRSSRVVPEFQAGLGAANLKFYYSQQFCDTFGGCSTTNTYLESSNHFQLHLGGGVRFYVKPSVFIRPQVDAHWVNNFFQFGSNWVPQYSVAIGYTFGER